MEVRMALIARMTKAAVASTRVSGGIRRPVLEPLESMSASSYLGLHLHRLSP